MVQGTVRVTCLKHAIVFSFELLETQALWNMQGLQILIFLLSNDIKYSFICTSEKTLFELVNGTSLIWTETPLFSKSLLSNVSWRACAQLGRILKSFSLFPAFSKTRNPTAKTLRWFYRETNPGAGSLILNRGLIYRHWSRRDFTWIWAHFCWTVFRSTMKWSLFGTPEYVSLLLRVKQFHIDHRSVVVHKILIQQKN